MPSLGKRISEERKRLGLSQSAFADLLGVSFSSQRRYEDGRSSPDTDYLDSLRRHGVDVQYVMTGREKQASKGYSFETLAEFGLAIAKGYQISPDELQCLANEVSEAMEKDKPSDSMEMKAVDQRVSSYEAAFFLHAAKLFEKRLKAEAPTLDSSLLTGILEGVDLALLAQSKSLSPAKKAQAVAMLYRVFKASGQVDQTMIDEAVKLAAT